MEIESDFKVMIIDPLGISGCRPGMAVAGGPSRVVRRAKDFDCIHRGRGKGSRKLRDK